MKASAFLMMMAAAMILTIYLHNIHTHSLRHLCQKVSFACSSDCPAQTADCVNRAEMEHYVHLAWNVTGSPTQTLFCLL